MLKFLCDFIGEDYNNITLETKYKVLGLDFMLHSVDEDHNDINNI
jgi:hypothetical protein